MSKHNFDSLVEIMRKLRSPGGCPWDAEQTHQSLCRYLIEECYEVIDAIEKGDSAEIKEELGDLLLQPLFHSAIAEERGDFNINDVIDGISEKLIRRHPHVFGDMEIKSAAAQLVNWEKIKKEEKKSDRKSAIDGIPTNLPALLKAQKITEKASRVGFDWENADQVMAKVMEELKEFEDARIAGDIEEMESELGDILFAIVNLGRFLSINPEDALRKTINRFETRFHHLEQAIQQNGKSLNDATLDEMEFYWNEAKKLEKR